jgi:glycosyltransferase involved in cell wall biosynthesis
MRVLHVGSGNLYGGIEKCLVTLARLRHLCPEMEQHFALCFRGQLEDELRESGVPVHALSEMHGRQPLAVIRNRRTLSRLQRQLQVDIVIYHSLWNYDLLALGGRPGSALRALWMHDAFDKNGRLEGFARFQRPGLLLSNSHYTAHSASMVYPNAIAKVLYCPVEFRCAVRDDRTRSMLRHSLHTADEAVVIVQTSRMEAWKGHRHHLNALSHLRDLQGWVLWIAGGAQRPEERIYLNSLRQQAESLGIADRVRFLGQRDDIQAILESADIHCQPNLSPEPFGIAFIEAMMAELPIASFRLGALPELIEDSCGVLCEPGNTTELASALRRLITDRPLRERLGGNGPRRARKLTEPLARLKELHAFLSESLSAWEQSKGERHKTLQTQPQGSEP